LFPTQYYAWTIGREHNPDVLHPIHDCAEQVRSQSKTLELESRIGTSKRPFFEMFVARVCSLIKKQRTQADKRLHQGRLIADGSTAEKN